MCKRVSKKQNYCTYKQLHWTSLNAHRNVIYNAHNNLPPLERHESAAGSSASASVLANNNLACAKETKWWARRSACSRLRPFVSRVDLQIFHSQLYTRSQKDADVCLVRE